MLFFTPKVCSFDPGGGGHSSPPFDPPPFDIIESSISMKIEILMFSIRNVFLTLRTDNQADNSFFQDSSLREREKQCSIQLSDSYRTSI